MNSTRRPLTPEDTAPRRVADGAGGALRDRLGAPPEGNFAEGVEAHVHYRKRMTPDMGEMWELGEYIDHARPDENGAVHLGGHPPRAIKFPVWFHVWFDRQSQRTLRILDLVIAWLDKHGIEEAEKRLADLDEIVDRHRARKKLVARLLWASKYAAPSAAATWGAIIFAKDRVDRVIEQMPVIRALWKAISGPAS